jgi:hypothetical protein
MDVVQNGFLVVSARIPIRERAAKTSEVLFCRFPHKSDADLPDPATVSESQVDRFGRGRLGVPAKNAHTPIPRPLCS